MGAYEHIAKRAAQVPVRQLCRVLQAHGLRAQQPRSFVPRTTDAAPAVRAAPNCLLCQPASTAPNRVWVGDITHLPRQGGSRL